MKCPTCNNELKFYDGDYLDDDIYNDELVLRQSWYCQECDRDYVVIRHYTQDGIHFENS